MGRSLLFGGLGGERLNDGDIGEQVGREMVARLEVGRGIVRDPNFAGGVFGDQDFEREIQRGARRSKHQRCACLGITEDQQLCGGHLETGAGGFAAVVDEGEELDPFGLQDGLQAGDGFVDGVIAGSAKNAELWNGWHGNLLGLRCVLLWNRLWASMTAYRGPTGGEKSKQRRRKRGWPRP